MDVKEQKRLPWHPLLAVVFVVSLYFAASLVGGILLGIGLMALGWDATRISQALKESSVGVQFSYVVLVEVITVGLLLLFLKLYKVSINRIGFKKPRLKDVGLGLASYPPYFIAFIVIVTVVSALLPGFNVNQEQQLGFNNVIGAVPLILTFISLVVLPPIVEELLFRGFLFSSFRARTGFWVTAVVTSVIFAAAHLSGGGSGGPLYIAALDTFILSILLCYLREKTGSIWASVVLHMLKNGIAYVSLFIITTT